VITTLTKVDEATLAKIDDEKQVRRTSELFLLFGMGSQFDHLIKQSVDKLGVYCLVADPASLSADDVRRLMPTGIILSGGPASVHVARPPFDCDIFDLGVPVLGICLGFQLWAQHRGLDVVPAEAREFGVHELAIYEHEAQLSSAELFAGIASGAPALQSHGLRIEPGGGLVVLAATDNAPVAAGRLDHLWGVQFHPEVTHTPFGDKLLENFDVGICGAQDRFPAEDVAEQKVAELRGQLSGGRKVLLALSGGSDSSTVAYLLREAVQGPAQIRGVYIKGIDRPDDEAFVRRYFEGVSWLELEVVDATDAFLEALAGHESIPAKRKAMKDVYRDVLLRAARDFGATAISQGTLYTDISESGGGYQSGAVKAKIKDHHNIDLDWEDLEEIAPLSTEVKDSGRAIGRAVGTPEELLTRHPFPGPGLVVRIEGEVTADKLAIARALDDIFIAELRRWGLYDRVWQAGVVVTNSITTCTKGDDATAGVVVAIWAVWSVNGFTAQWAELPNDFLRAVSQRMTNEVPAVGRVVYNISDKPPATIEWG